MNFYTVPGIKAKITPQYLTVPNQMRLAEQIIEQVANFYETDPLLVRSKDRNGHTVKVRHMAIYMVLQKVKGMSLKRLGMLVARDHTSVIHARKCINDQLSAKHDNEYKNDVKILTVFLCFNITFG